MRSRRVRRADAGRDGGQVADLRIVGYAAGAVCSRARPHLLAYARGAFCISVMAGHHERICRAFSARGTDRFSSVAWRPRLAGPGLDDAVAWLDCRLREEHPAGDHTIVVCEVTAAESAESGSKPLVFFRGRYGSFAERGS